MEKKSVNRRAVLAGFTTSVAPLPAFAGVRGTDLPRVALMQRLSAEADALFDRANRTGDVQSAVNACGRFEAAATETYRAAAVTLDDLGARAVIARHYTRDRSGPHIALFEAHLRRKAEAELLAAALAVLKLKRTA